MRVKMIYSCRKCGKKPIRYYWPNHEDILDDKIRVSGAWLIDDHDCLNIKTFYYEAKPAFLVKVEIIKEIA